MSGFDYDMKFFPECMSGACELCGMVECGREGWVDTGPVTQIGLSCARKIVAIVPARYAKAPKVAVAA